MNATPRGAENSQTFPSRELAQRIGSAAVLAAGACFLTYAGLWPFALLVAVSGVILAWEWSRMVRGRAPDAAFTIHALTSGAVCLLTAAGMLPAAAIALAAGALAAAFSAPPRQTRIWSGAGVLYTGLAGLVLVQLRSDAAYGLAAILFVFLIVWSADTAAYFTGRSLGGPRLAPAISPGKTWSGFAGGLIVPTLMAYAFALWLGTTSAPALALAGAALALSSQLGDLAESSVKRTFDLKDAGRLLPGHGGLFDRVDGLIGAALAAGLIFLFRDMLNPGKALLIWP